MANDKRKMLGSGSAKVVLQAHNVVFAEITSALDLDKDQIFVAGVLNAMRRADRNVNRFTGADRDLATVERDPGSSFDDEPVLRAL